MKHPALLYEKKSEQKVICKLCSHRCLIKKDEYGLCNVRKNIQGELYTLVYGEPVASNLDPIEKKPLYHFMPGTQSYSIATIGCNFKCPFCQNWQISQGVKKELIENGNQNISPEKIVENAVKAGAKSMAYTYTEPTIFFEYAYDISKLAYKKNIKNVFVTNGYMTDECLEKINPYLDAANVDIKYFKDESYKKICGARLRPVLESIKKMKKLGIWIEITTLIIPGENDSHEELKNIAEFISNLDSNIPWHISRFFPQYNYTDKLPTPMETMEKAKTIGIESGLRYIYLGNVAGGTKTECPKCGTELIVRRGYSIVKNKIRNGRCPECGKKISGIWN
ncbi:MAG: AmmeMemoRadiSam system radical SAM enzyme [Elusimicrobiota bacterium]